MRVAVALSGLPRISPISAASWGRIIGHYNADVYVHSWYNDECTQDYITDQIRWVFKPDIVIVESVPNIDVSQYPDRHWPYINVDRSLSMWTSIEKSHQMVKDSGNDYDVVIRGRMDWHVHAFDIIQFDGVVIPWDNDKIPLRFTYKDTVMSGLNDHFAYGPMNHMNTYVNTLHEIPILYAHEAVDYCPENFLAANLVKYNVPVMLQNLEHCLIRS